MISIIVPIYNCKQYLHKCLDSLIHQTYSNIEILLIDDGSTDGSASICEEYCRNDARVRVIHKENEGVSSARNAGISISTGDYIIFVDADDWLDCDACKKIVDQIDEKIYLYFWNFRKCVGDLAESQKNFYRPTSIQELMSDIIACPVYQNPYIRASWGKVYKRELINDLIFPEDIYIGEDACFLLECLKKISSIQQVKFISDSWYNYRIIQSSAVRKYKKDLLEQSIAQFKYIKNFVSNMDITDEKTIATAMTMFCWGISITLKKNELKIRTKSDDCKTWMKLASNYLRNPRIEPEKMSKFIYFCWKICRVTNEYIMGKLLGLYVRYKQRREN